MEAKESSGQSSVYNTYATPPSPNPLFLGFSRYLNVNKEIILSAELGYTKRAISSLLEDGSFCIFTNP